MESEMANGDRAIRPAPIPLPATREEMIANKKTKTVFSLNDAVEVIHLALYGENDDYMRFLNPVYPESSEEGWLVLDDAAAAHIVKDYAGDHEMPLVVREKTAAIIKALRVVWRRYGISRDERAGKVGGQRVGNSPRNYAEEPTE
jgi:hypothetical protein